MAETPVIAGAGAVELTDTLSKRTVASAEFDALHVTRPTYAFWAMLIVWVVPICFHVDPLYEE